MESDSTNIYHQKLSSICILWTGKYHKWQIGCTSICGWNWFYWVLWSV